MHIFKQSKTELPFVPSCSRIPTRAKYNLSKVHDYRADLLQALESQELAAQVVEVEQLAERLRVSAAPAFVVDRQKLATGVRTIAELRRLCGT